MISDQLPNIKALIIDMDGVLWRDNQAIGELPSIITRIQDLGYDFILATNNSTRTVEEYLEKLAGFGVMLTENQVLTTANALGIYLQECYPQGADVYVIGQPSLKETLTRYGMRLVDETFQEVDVVIASIDYALTYEKLKHASLLIQSGSEFVGTNPDRTLPTPEGFTPGSGVVVEALEAASGIKAKIIGKPEPMLYQMALKRLGLTSQETLVIGDRLETDIIGAQAAGMYSALVLSGVSSLADVEKFDPKPDLIAQNLTELIS